MSEARGSLILVPNTLDFGTPGEPPDLQDVLPLAVLQTAARLAHWVAENAKTTRAFLKRVDVVVALARPLQAIDIVELPRAQKGGQGGGQGGGQRGGQKAGAPASITDLGTLLGPARDGFDIGLISEAGLPAVADPGALLVQAAHAAGISVIALPGPSALLLALAASGLNGQSFAFVGYLPIAPDDRAARIRELETLSRRQQQTQLMIETPYRNEALLGALLAHLQPGTRLSVSCGLTLAAGFTRSDAARAWQSRPTQLPADVPAVFALLAN